jgi:hypothetical protein
MEMAQAPRFHVNLLSESIVGPDLKMLRIPANEQYDCSGFARLR